MANNNIVNQYSSTFVQIFNDVVRRYESNLDIIKQTEEALTDVEHEIELGSSRDMYRGYLLYKQIKDLRMKRRQCKDENQLLQDMYDYIKSPQGQSFKNKIQSIQGSSAKIYESQAHRTYTPRQLNNLTIANKTCEVHPPFEDLLAQFNENKATVRNGMLRK